MTVFGEEGESIRNIVDLDFREAFFADGDQVCDDELVG